MRIAGLRTRACERIRVVGGKGFRNFFSPRHQERKDRQGREERIYH